ncbi:hypothetical protein IFVP203_C1180003 [Vibrio parahaemolyticus]
MVAELELLVAASVLQVYSCYISLGGTGVSLLILRGSGAVGIGGGGGGATFFSSDIILSF